MPVAFLFDVADKRNAAAIKEFAAIKKKKDNKDANLPLTEADRFAIACQKNSVRCENINTTKAFHASDLVRPGYGSKADLIVNCGLRNNAYKIRRYILDNDIYDISDSTMTDILLRARHENPALIKIADLKKRLGKELSKNALTEAIFAEKLNIITENACRLTNSADYLIDLSDKKNLEFLTTINNEAFQIWLSDKLELIKTYKENNENALEEFKTRKVPTKTEETIEIRSEFAKIQEKIKHKWTHNVNF